MTVHLVCSGINITPDGALPLKGHHPQQAITSAPITYKPSSTGLPHMPQLPFLGPPITPGPLSIVHSTAHGLSPMGHPITYEFSSNGPPHIPQLSSLDPPITPGPLSIVHSTAHGLSPMGHPITYEFSSNGPPHIPQLSSLDPPITPGPSSIGHPSPLGHPIHYGQFHPWAHPWEMGNAVPQPT
ncbi:hypothetical protein PAXRUDRAFT_806321 [Paxillus rubicundulus Ve08.2h10]|uniref:Unplaced genomic scaffold scaffold_895, whole genome shotgun sequence n=1 Tax=Paxillus rubicundulus Ve08.2h10 TaxID=930991 RepID=A0A0D0DCG1_9AGAM|nr:hypothetical protein PAXRUDRAFT_806321 [Paxillus rubicundulus Ve08.2h10]